MTPEAALCEHGYPTSHWIGLPTGNDPDGLCPGPAARRWHSAQCQDCGSQVSFRDEDDRNEWAEQHHAATGHVILELGEEPNILGELVELRHAVLRILDILEKDKLRSMRTWTGFGLAALIFFIIAVVTG